MRCNADSKLWHWVVVVSLAGVLAPRALSGAGDTTAPHPPAAPAAGAPGEAARPPEAPRASFVGSEKCAACHKKIGAAFATGRHAATGHPSVPQDLRGCEACHGPASAHVGGDKDAILNPAKLKPGDGDGVCLKCHGEGSGSAAPQGWQKLAARRWVRSPHARKGVACVSCHGEHGGEGNSAHVGAGLEAGPGAAAQCLRCHTAMQPKADAYQHAPVASGLCVKCHDPHAPGRPGLVRETVDTVCAGCHKPEGAAFATAHSGYPMKGTRCTSCHSAHMTAKGGKGLPASQHAPYAQRKCTLCHQSPGTSGKAELKKPVKELCVQCHAGVAESMADGKAASTHFPVKERFCTGCHDPHGSHKARPPLFRASTERTCVACHQQIETAAASGVKHAPVEAGNCLTCHMGHRSAQEKLLTKAPIDLCKGCHPEEHRTTHPVGFRGEGAERRLVKDPRDGKMLVCSSCHAVHGGEHPHLTSADPKRDLCVLCHKVGR